MPEDKKLTIQQLLNTLDPERLTKEDFVKSFEQAVLLFKTLEESNKKAIEQLTTAFNEVSAKLKDDNSLDLSDVKKEIVKQLKKALDNQSVSLNFVKDKVSKLKSGDDGLDADEDIIVDKVLSLIKLPEQKEILFDTPKQFRDKVVSIIEELIKEIIRDVKNLQTRPVGGGIVGRDIIKEHDLSSSLNGTLKTFALPAFWRILEVTSSSFPTTFRKTVDYTTNELTMEITFTSEVDASTMLASGQSITILYVSA